MMSKEQLSFLNNLNKQQQDVCIASDNILLKACPGSGKTRTLTYRLAYWGLMNKPSQKLNIAITYTNRAADEIKRRLKLLDVSDVNIWAGTIHQFCLESIIRPYSMYDKRTSRGFKIIDEYVERKYRNEILESKGRLQELRYVDKKDLPQEIMETYRGKLEENKELDFDMILDIGETLLRKGFICDNLSSIINTINVDEYQDTNELQYKIIENIVKKNNDIIVMFVGDIDQAIYGGIGGVAKDKDTLEKEFGVKFYEKKLDGCYRSTQRLIDYYRQFQANENDIISLADIKDNNGHIAYSENIDRNSLISYIAKVIEHNLENGISESEMCIVAPRWELLYPLSRDLKELLPDINFDAPDITPIKYDPLNVFYLIARLTFTKAGQNTWLRKKAASDLLVTLRDDYRIDLKHNIDNYDILTFVNSSKNKRQDEKNGIKYLEYIISDIFDALDIKLESEDLLNKTYIDFMDKIDDRVSRFKLDTDVEDLQKCFQERRGIVITTFHGVKGEEYDTVIAYGILKGYIPHWNLIFSDNEEYCTNETNKLLYVVCSRARENLYLISEQGRYTNNGNPYEATEQMVEYYYEYDNDSFAV